MSKHRDKDIKDNLPRDFNKSHAYVDINKNNCICALPKYNLPVKRQDKKDNSKKENITCVKIVNQVNAYELLMLLMHILEVCNNCKNDIKYWSIRNYIVKNINNVYLLVRVNDDKDYLTYFGNQSCEILSFCIVKQILNCVEISALQSFVPGKGYARMLIDEMVKDFDDATEDDLYVPEKEMNNTKGFWIKVLSCWERFYYFINDNFHGEDNDGKDKDGRDRNDGKDKDARDRNERDKDDEDKDDEIKIGKRSYVNAWGYIREREYKNEKIFDWILATHHDNRLSPYEIISFLPDKGESLITPHVPEPIVDIIINYDNSLGCAVERVYNSLIIKTGFKLMDCGFTPYNKTNKDMIQLDDIEILLYELPVIFWPAPNWQGSYGLKHIIEEVREGVDEKNIRNQYPRHLQSRVQDINDYCSNGSFIMSALLLGYSIDKPEFNNPNVNIRLDEIPSKDMIKTVKKYYQCQK